MADNSRVLLRVHEALEMLKDAIQGWLEVASEREKSEPEKQLVEISL